MTDLERVLSRLLHDLRSPMGVASGYLRLVRDGRLGGPEDVDRAIAKAQDALRVMATVCGDATSWLDAGPPAAPRPVAAGAFLARVASHAATRLPGLDLPEPGVTALTLGGDHDQVARAVVELLAVVAAPSQAPAAAGIEGDTLWFAVMAPAGTDVAPAFDPWRSPGFGAPLAHRAITEAGGRCDTAPDRGQKVRITFTLAPS